MGASLSLKIRGHLWSEMDLDMLFCVSVFVLIESWGTITRHLFLFVYGAVCSGQVVCPPWGSVSSAVPVRAAVGL